MNFADLMSLTLSVLKATYVDTFFMCTSVLKYNLCQCNYYAHIQSFNDSPVYTSEPCLHNCHNLIVFIAFEIHIPSISLGLYPNNVGNLVSWWGSPSVHWGR